VSPSGGHRGARRAGLVALAVVLAAVAVGASLLFFSSRDTPRLATGTGPGEAFRDLGSRALRPGERPGVRYDSDPPTSGPHVPTAVTRDATTLTDDQILTALAAGNVVLLYGGATPPAGLRALATAVAGPFDTAVARSGQAVILARRPGTRGVVALAWAHRQVTPDAADPRLRAFAESWLGRGAS